MTPYQINIKKIFSENSGKDVPQILCWFIEKIIRASEMNKFLAGAGYGKFGADFANAVLQDFLQLNIEIIGDLPPKGGRYCFAANHPFGGIDGLILLKTIGDYYEGKVNILLNSLLASLPGLAPIAVPVNITGKSRGAAERSINQINSAFNSDNQVIILPAGKCSRSIDGMIQDDKWKPTFVKEAINTKRSIVPMYFEGGNSKNFYSFARFCRRLSTILNKPGLDDLPMIFLPKEMLKMHGSKITLVIGEPIDPQSLQIQKEIEEKSNLQLAQSIRDDVYMLRKNIGVKNLI